MHANCKEEEMMQECVQLQNSTVCRYFLTKTKNCATCAFNKPNVDFHSALSTHSKKELH